MSFDAYSALYKGYDKLNSETDYSLWADFIEKIFAEYGENVESVLDMGCGTGAMTFELSRRGYDMIGVDISSDMLSVARERAYEEGDGNILWLCQDMTELDLYGTVQAVVCCLDGINHLTNADDMEKCFSLVYNFLEPGGVFVFDVNTPYKFENFYGQNDYVLEDEGVLCAWQNDYDRQSKICGFYLSVFEKEAGGKWKRTDTEQLERCYSREEISDALVKSGFEICGFFGDFRFNKPESDCDRWYIAAKVKDK